jgi:hypothetical protein
MLQDPARSNQVLVEEIRALRAEVAALRRSNEAGDLAIASSTNKTAKILDRWDGDGQPDVRTLT